MKLSNVSKAALTSVLIAGALLSTAADAKAKFFINFCTSYARLGAGNSISGTPNITMAYTDGYNLTFTPRTTADCSQNQKSILAAIDPGKDNFKNWKPQDGQYVTAYMTVTSPSVSGVKNGTCSVNPKIRFVVTGKDSDGYITFAPAYQGTANIAGNGFIKLEVASLPSMPTPVCNYSTDI